MSSRNLRGVVYRCPVCGAEVSVVARRTGDFAPRCCNCDMIPLERKLTFHVCPVCGAEIAILKQGAECFTPRCCNTNMVRKAA